MLKHLIATLVTAALAVSTSLPAAAYTPQEEQELQIGQQVQQHLQQKGEIITSSPYYSTLTSIATRIKSVADKQYFVPFHFILVHESQPNAFSVPGGDVYVTDSMMRFVQNKEELAGVLCHETAHAIHHDVMNNMRKDQNLSLIATGLSLLLGGGRNSMINQGIGLAANLQAMTFSREVEHDADHTGAYLCAQGGINPWGMVWLFEKFEQNPTGAPPEALSDHPRDDHRISDLEAEFHSDLKTFGKFSSDIATATPINSSGWKYDYLASSSVAAKRPPHTAANRSNTSAWKFNTRSCCK